ncbi:MAG TPA: hypothetical protein PLU93_11045 [Treponemataceae bacterium]|jgi:hypothetical protein|nr:hypothetical protein [Treponemataceae bacterium]
MLRKSRKQLTIRFLHRTILFCASFSVALLAFFAFGNYQDFLDETQLVILRSMVLAGIATFLLSATMIITGVVVFVRERKRLYLRLMASGALFMFFGAALALLGAGIILLSDGL